MVFLDYISFGAAVVRSMAKVSHVPILGSVQTSKRALGIKQAVAIFAHQKLE